MERILLWVDDIRDPHKCLSNILQGSFHIIWVKNYKEFVKYIINNELPNFISFDHDLGLGKSGYDCAVYLVDYALDNNIKRLPECACHSANPVGRDNILGIINSFNKFMSRDKLIYD